MKLMIQLYDGVLDKDGAPNGNIKFFENAV